jgi:predicted small lipoprotein YifL
MRHGRRFLGNTLLAAALLVALAACGHRGDPLPPLRHTPPALQEFRLAQRGNGLEMSVLAPGSSVDGIAYESLAIEFLSVEGPKDIEKTGRKRQVLARPLERVVETLPLPAPGSIARAAARGIYGKEKGPRTLTMGLVVQSEVRAPGGLEVGLTESGVRLAWTGDVPEPVSATVQPQKIPGLPSTGPGPGTPPSAPTSGPAPAPAAAGVGEGVVKIEPEKSKSGFLVYRRVGSAAYARPLPPGLLDKRALQDAVAPKGEKVCYVVRAAASLEPLVESAASNEACLDVRDISPPAAPTGLAVVPRERGLEVVWTPSTDQDVAAYRVYREGPGEPRRRLAEIPAGGSAWTDEAAKPGVTYRYSLTAVDQAGNESAATAPVEASRE